MKIPLRSRDLKYSSMWPKWIIIHHTHESVPQMRNDTSKFQSDYVQNMMFIKGKKVTGYNMFVEKVNDDYQVSLSQPLFTKCEWDDLTDEQQVGIHIGIVGNFDEDIPMDRMYNVIAFRVLAPLMRVFKIPIERVVMHKSISKEHITCPGEFFDMDRLTRAFRTVFRASTTISRHT